MATHLTLAALCLRHCPSSTPDCLHMGLLLTRDDAANPSSPSAWQVYDTA